MRVLLLNQFFWPDSAATSQLLTDLARGLKERGHEVHAICAGGGYALQDETNDPQVTIHRVKAAPFMRGKLGRVLSYVSFLFSCGLQGLFGSRPDLVVTLTTPPLLSLIGTAIKTLRGSKHFIWEMDVYPDVAVDLEYIKAGGLVDRLTGALVDFSRKRADGILALGHCMRDRLMARGISGETIHVADNWADGQSIYPVPRPSFDNSLVMLYSGNLGLAHDVDTISEAIEQLDGDQRFRFVFAGGGPLRKGLEARCRQAEIKNTEFRSYSQRESLGASLGNCDIGLITQRESCLGSVVPSKIYGLLAAGRAVLFIGPRKSTVTRILRQFDCGWQVDNGDSAGVIELLRLLAQEPSLVDAAGRRARHAFEENFDLPLGVERICSLLGASKKEANPEELFSVSARGVPAVEKLT